MDVKNENKMNELKKLLSLHNPNKYYLVWFENGHWRSKEVENY